VAPYKALAASTDLRRSASAASRPCGWPPCRSCKPARRGRFRARPPALRARRWSDCRSARNSNPVFAPEDAIQLLHALVEVTGGGINRSGGGHVRAGLLPVARMHRFGLYLHDDFLFQRVPDLVSSRMMPCSSNCWRIWSDEREIARLLGIVARLHHRFHFRVAICPLSAVGCNTANTESKRARNSSAGARLPPAYRPHPWRC
jgi:hypothetical protein